MQASIRTPKAVVHIHIVSVFSALNKSNLMTKSISDESNEYSSTTMKMAPKAGRLTIQSHASEIDHI